MTYRIKHMVVATDAGILITFSDLSLEREEQHPNTGQPHEDTPEKEGRGGEEGRKKRAAIFSHWFHR